jgi:sirohydrochlorin cobaltochelatase
MRAVQARVAEQAGAVDVRLAFLEFMNPTLSEAVSELVAGGAGRIVILPMFIARGGHLKRELPEMIGQLRLAYPDVEFSLAPVIGEQERVIQAMADSAREITGL